MNVGNGGLRLSLHIQTTYLFDSPRFPPPVLFALSASLSRPMNSMIQWAALNILWLTTRDWPLSPFEFNMGRRVSGFKLPLVGTV